MNEADIWRVANDMIRQYGSGAQACARARAEVLREYEIQDGFEDWQRIANAIAELDRKKPDIGESLN